jgi:hypothetical protein
MSRVDAKRSVLPRKAEAPTKAASRRPPSVVFLAGLGGEPALPKTED